MPVLVLSLSSSLLCCQASFQTIFTHFSSLLIKIFIIEFNHRMLTLSFISRNVLSNHRDCYFFVPRLFFVGSFSNSTLHHLFSAFVTNPSKTHRYASHEKDNLSFYSNFFQMVGLNLRFTSFQNSQEIKWDWCKHEYYYSGINPVEIRVR